jgi:hypothetical protein
MPGDEIPTAMPALIPIRQRIGRIRAVDRRLKRPTRRIGRRLGLHRGHRVGVPRDNRVVLGQRPHIQPHERCDTVHPSLSPVRRDSNGMPRYDAPVSCSRKQRAVASRRSHPVRRIALGRLASGGSQQSPSVGCQLRSASPSAGKRSRCGTTLDSHTSDRPQSPWTLRGGSPGPGGVALAWPASVARRGGQRRLAMDPRTIPAGAYRSHPAVKGGATMRLRLGMPGHYPAKRCRT